MDTDCPIYVDMWWTIELAGLLLVSNYMAGCCNSWIYLHATLFGDWVSTGPTGHRFYLGIAKNVSTNV
jgi:hypothetical protein